MSADPMVDRPTTRPRVQIPDLLAALTAQGLAGRGATGHGDDRPRRMSAVPERLSWLGRWLERRFDAAKEY